MIHTVELSALINPKCNIDFKAILVCFTASGR